MPDAWCGRPDTIASTLKAAATAVGLDIGFQWNEQQKAAYPNETAFMLLHGNIVSNSRLTLAQLQPTQGAFDFDAADEWVNWANALGLSVVHAGHLIWGEALPSWVTNITNSTTLRSVLEDHVTTVIDHFGDRVASWNVVNEAISDFGSPNPGDLRTNHWYTTIGADYVKYAFQAAASVASESQSLVLNQAWFEWADDVAYTGSVSLLTDLLNDGVRVDGFGAQFHLREDENDTGQTVADRLNVIGDLGLDVYVTELDVLDKDYPLSTRYQDCADHALAILGPVCAQVTNLRHIVMWDVSDTTSWLNEYEPYSRSDGVELAGGQMLSRLGRYNPFADAVLSALAMRS